jgi:hypothetical protein
MNFNIYLIRSQTQPTDKVYIGSTKKTLEQRVKEHLAHYHQYVNGNASYCSSFDIIETGDIKIEFLEATTHDKRYEREGFYIKLLKSVGCNVVNIKQAGRSQKESMKIWKQNNPDYHKQYYQKMKNKDKPVINIQEVNIIVDNMVIS